MPTFIKIGREDRNLSGNTSKGYIITKSGKQIIIRYGSIHSKARKYYWAGKRLPMILKKTFRNLIELEKYYKQTIRDRENKNYIKLNSRTTIKKFPSN